MRLLPSAPAGPTHNAAPRRAIIIHPGALGDLVQALPALAAVRGGWPGTHLTLVTDAALAPWLAPLGLVDATVGFDAAVAYRGRALARAVLLSRLVRSLRAARPDVAVVLKGAGVYAALAAVSGAAHRVGLVRGRAARLLTHPVAVSAARHRADRYADVVRALGLDPDHAAPIRWPDAPLPLPTGPRAPRRWLVVAPGGARNAKETMSSRRWPAERFAAVAAGALARDAALGAALVGGPGDREEAERVARALPPDRTANLVGATDLFTARAVIAAGVAYLGNDSGLMHLAGTTDTPVVAVFGPTDPRVAAPRGPDVHALWSPVRPTACVDDATGRHRPCAAVCCIDRVSVPAVEAVLARVLDGAPAPARAGAPRPSAVPGRI